MYAFDADGVNITLQSAAAIITESMNRLATDGVFVRDVDGGNVSWLTPLNFKGEYTLSLRGVFVCFLFFNGIKNQQRTSN